MGFPGKTFLFFFAFGWLGACFSHAAWGQTLITVAGGGTPNPTPGALGDGGPATLAVIGGPEDIALDSQGNLYIADGINVLVRKVTIATGVITTVAGTALTNNYTGDGGPATLATLNYPSGLALDAQDNLYIADFYNNVVRKVASAGGTITTVVGNGASGYAGDGGLAALAEISNPEDIRFDSLGNLYIADLGNHVVRKVDPLTQKISTVAGNGTAGNSGDGLAATMAQLTGPHSLAFDASGNFFITDDGGYVIRRVDASTGIITKVAGSAGVTGFSPDGTTATSADLSQEIDGLAVGCGGNLYFADDFNQRLRGLSGGTLTTIAGTGTQGYSNNVPAPTAPLNHPEALLFDKTGGSLYVANYGSGTVQKILLLCTPTPPFSPTPTATYTPTPVATGTPTAAGCGAPIESYCYPNPATGNTATILCNLCEPGQVGIHIYNTAAELLGTYSFQGTMGVNNFPINIGGLAHGIYYYIVKAQGPAGTHQSNTLKFAVVR